MMQSDAIDKLAAALSKVQAELTPALKDAENPAFKQGGKVSRYADLASVWDACRKPLTDNGLAVIQSPGLCGGNQVEMTTTLVHSSGQFISGTLSIPLAKVDAHGYGSALTYSRRYALAAMIGVISDDDDGNGAVKATGAANDEPAARAALSGPHTSKTALRTAVHAVIAAVRAAQSLEAIDDIQKKNIATIKQANVDWPILLTGDPNLEEDIGLKGVIELRRTELDADSAVNVAIDSMKNCEDRVQLEAWMESNAGALEAFDGADSRRFQAAYDQFEAGLAQVAALQAG